MREKACCFTGHRQLPEDHKAEIIAKLEDIIVSLIHSGYLYFGAGGGLRVRYSGGVDGFALAEKLPSNQADPCLAMCLSG